MLLKHTHQIFRAHRYQRLPTRLHASAGRDGFAEASEGMPGAAKLACASAVLKSHPFVHSLIPSWRMGLGHLPRGQMLEQAPGTMPAATHTEPARMGLAGNPGLVPALQRLPTNQCPRGAQQPPRRAPGASRHQAQCLELPMG